MEVERNARRRGPTVNRSKGSFPVAIVEFVARIILFRCQLAPPGALTPETRVKSRMGISAALLFSRSAVPSRHSPTQHAEVHSHQPRWLPAPPPRRARAPRLRRAPRCARRPSAAPSASPRPPWRKAGTGDLPAVRLTAKNGDTATAYLFGVVTSFVKNGRDVLYVRPDAVFDKSKPISGGPRTAAAVRPGRHPGARLRAQRGLGAH